jgi:DnaJ-class molecular chaperone
MPEKMVKVHCSHCEGDGWTQYERSCSNCLGKGYTLVEEKGWVQLMVNEGRIDDLKRMGYTEEEIRNIEEDD